MRSPRLRLAAFASIYLFWGSTYPAISYLVRYVPPFLLSGARLFTAGILLLALARWRGCAWPSLHQWLGGTAAGLVFLVLGNGVATWGLQYIEAGRATLLTAIVPLAAMAYAWAFQGRPVGGRVAFCLASGFLGVALLARPGAGAAVPHAGWGLGAILFSVTAWAWGIAEVARFTQVQDGVLASGVQMASAGLILLGASALREHPASVAFAALPPLAWGAWAFLVLGGSCVGYLSFNWLIHHEPPALAGTYAFVNPVVAVFLGWAFLGESVHALTLVAAVLIVAAVAGLLLLQKPDAALA